MADLTDRSEIRRLCDKYGFSLSKGFGQNFIVNPGVCPRICEVSGIGPDSNVLEIGPGFGTLTQQLAQRAGKVVSVELDSRLVPVLRETMSGHSNFTLVQGDVLRLDLERLLRQEFDGHATVCANLPYYITSPILMKLLESRLPLDSITVMVQREAAQRIVADPGTRQAGAISYAVHYYASPKLDFTVGPGSFFPPPKVHSSVITLKLNPFPLLGDKPEQEKHLFSLVRASFSQRRKTLVNAASAGLGLPKPKLLEAVEAIGLDLRIRPEQLTLQQYVQLQSAIWRSS